MDNSCAASLLAQLPSVSLLLPLKVKNVWDARWTAIEPCEFCSLCGAETLFPWCIKFFGWFPRMLSFFPPCKENCTVMTWLRVFEEINMRPPVFKCFNQCHPNLGHLNLRLKVAQQNISWTWVPASVSLVIPLLGLVSPPSPWLRIICWIILKYYFGMFKNNV